MLIAVTKSDESNNIDQSKWSPYCDEALTSQKANQWKRSNPIFLDSKIVGRHYSCTV